MKGLGNLMKQAQKMQEDMQKAQEEIANMEVDGTSGGDMVKVRMTGNHDVKKVTIDDTLMNEDKEMLEDLIAAAINDAVQQIDKQKKEKMSGMTAGLNIPGLKLPF